MKRGLKMLILAIAIILVILGTLKVQDMNKAGSEQVVQKVLTNRKFNQVKVDTSNANIKVKRGSHYRVLFEGRQKLLPKVEIKNKQLIVEDKDGIKVVNGNLFDLFKKHSVVPQITIELPNEKLKNIEIDNSNGSVTVQGVATAKNVADMINASGFTLKTSKAEGGEKDAASTGDEVINPGKAVEMVAGKNLTVKQESNGKVTYATASNVTFNSVQFGDNGPKITNNGGNINVGTATGAPTKITGVAPGEISPTSTDAINGSQLHSVAAGINNRIGSLENKIDMADKNLRGGVAQAIAAAGLVQAYLPGKSLVAIGGGVYRGEAGYAIGYSSISDNGNWIIKGTASGNSRGHFGASSSVGYQW